MLGVCLTLCGGYSEAQWEFVLSHFAPHDIYLLGGEEPTGKVFRGATRIHSLAAIADKELVVMAPKDGRNVQGEKSLPEFAHPENAVYVFGSDKEHMTLDIYPDHLVYIPTDSKDELFAHVAAAITLWDRRHGQPDNRQ